MRRIARATYFSTDALTSGTRLSNAGRLSKASISESCFWPSCLEGDAPTRLAAGAAGAARCISRSRATSACSLETCSSRPPTYSFLRSRAMRADSAFRCIRCVSFCSLVIGPEWNFEMSAMSSSPRSSIESSAASSSSSIFAAAAAAPRVDLESPSPAPPPASGSGGIAGGSGMPFSGFWLGLSQPGCATAFSPAAHMKHERRSSSTKSLTRERAPGSIDSTSDASFLSDMRRLGRRKAAARARRRGLLRPLKLRPTSTAELSRPAA